MSIFLLKEIIARRTTRSFSTKGFLCPNSTLEFSHLLKECQSLLHLRSTHQQIVVRGLLMSHGVSCTPSSLGACILSAYVSHGAQDEALSTLEQLFPSSNFWWNVLIKKGIEQDDLHHVLYLCHCMQCLGTKPDQFTLLFVLKACGKLGSFGFGTSAHAFICKSRFDSNVYISNALISFYAKCGAFQEANNVFSETISRGIADVVTWNSMIGACVQNRHMHVAIDVFKKMMSMRYDATSDVQPDVISLVNVLPACSSLQASSPGKQIHAFALRNGLIADVFVGNAILDLYAKCRMMVDAQRAFDIMKVKDVVSWNAMVTGYSQFGNFDCTLELFKRMREGNILLDVVTWSALIAAYAQRDHAQEAIDVFRQMQLSGVDPNAITLISLLSACASMGALRLGMETHGYALRRCLLDVENHERGDLLVHNAFIDMYSKCRSIAAACTIFDMTSVVRRDVVTWTVMIGGYAQHGDANSALELFSEMLLSGAGSPNNFTIACVLIACARLSTLHFGKQVHAFVIRKFCYSAETFVANCLIDMYSKCGDIGRAQIVFNGMPRKDDVSWTSLMTAYGMHGHVEDALRIFENMRETGVVPDAVTLLVVLYACSHAGMVDEGMKIFRNMNRDYGVVATVEHYACVVDLLGRAGHLQEAKELIDGMPMEPTMVIWVALLNACRIHSNVELGEFALQRLLDMKYEGDGSYTLLSNIYANAKRWKDVARIRSIMKKYGVKKRPGCSWIQGKKGASTFIFFSGDRSHPQSEQIYATLAKLMQQIKDIGYEPMMDCALHDVDDEEKSNLLVEHSEKLALAFGILIVTPGAPIRITKNLRVCGDCHSAFIYISKIIDHEIILRDSSRFHHFKNGSCSCGGYW